MRPRGFSAGAHRYTGGMTPILIVSGTAGSGKDTVSQFIAERHNGVCVALADPLKRFLLDTFLFPEADLWGPSEARNKRSDLYPCDWSWQKVLHRLQAHGPQWLRTVFPSYNTEQLDAAYLRLENWFAACRQHYAEAERLGEDRRPTARYLLQTLGTEFARRIDPDVWIRYGTSVALKLLTPGWSYQPAAGLVQDPGSNGYSCVIITDGRFKNEILGVKVLGGSALHVTTPRVTNRADEAGISGHSSEAEQRYVPDHWFDAVLINDHSHGIYALKGLTMVVSEGLPALKVPMHYATEPQL